MWVPEPQPAEAPGPGDLAPGSLPGEGGGADATGPIGTEGKASVTTLGGGATGPTALRPPGIPAAALAPEVPAATLRRQLVRAWPALRYVLGLGLAGLALWVLAGQKDELRQLGSVLSGLRWWWAVPALALEAASFSCFARMQANLLIAGGVKPRFRSLLAMTLAAQSVNNSLPAGAAFSAIYGFRWYRRFGADEKLAAWSLVGTMLGAALSLALVAAGGVAMATSQGASLNLIGVVIGVLIVTMLAGALLLYERPLIAVTSWSVRVARRVVGRPRGDLDEAIARVVSWITVVRMTWREGAAVVGWGLGNWLFDCGTFAFCFLAVGAPVPLKGLLLAYGAGQLAANLPITPGGLGAVEGSITIALVAFGGQETSTVAAVLLYRVISFWLQLPVGWSCAAVLARGVHHHRWAAKVRYLGHEGEAGAPGADSAPAGDVSHAGKPNDVERPRDVAVGG